MALWRSSRCDGSARRHPVAPRRQGGTPRTPSHLDRLKKCLSTTPRDTPAYPCAARMSCGAT
eukprot:2800246-Alexandrium_andersonii.AAC.1